MLSLDGQNDKNLKKWYNEAIKSQSPDSKQLHINEIENHKNKNCDPIDPSHKDVYTQLIKLLWKANELKDQIVH